MGVLTFCAVGAVVCVAWFFLQMRIFAWADEKPSLLSKTVKVVSLALLSTSISVILFALAALFCQMVLNAIFGS
jgi:hypothetical protein